MSTVDLHSGNVNFQNIHREVNGYFNNGYNSSFRQDLDRLKSAVELSGREGETSYTDNLKIGKIFTRSAGMIRMGTLLKNNESRYQNEARTIMSKPLVQTFLKLQDIWKKARDVSQHRGPEILELQEKKRSAQQNLRRIFTVLTPLGALSAFGSASFLPLTTAIAIAVFATSMIYGIYLSSSAGICYYYTHQQQVLKQELEMEKKKEFDNLLVNILIQARREIPT
ncbi:MAG: hypothetical protein AAGI90_06070 [Chlamydiota bacterium]